MKTKTVSILGCGWLGLPLAEKLYNKGYTVNGTTTSEPKLKLLKSKNISPFLIRLTETSIEGHIEDFLLNSEVLIINIPPGLRKNPKKNHVSEITQLLSYIEKSSIKKVLFISSTSVFKDKFPINTITEKTPPNGTSNSAKQLIEIENIIRNHPNINASVLRFSGLFDAERHPGKILSGKRQISNPKAPINLIHKDDCIEIMASIIENQLWNTTLNVAYPYHPTKVEYYSNYSKVNGLRLPEFENKETSKGKIIDGSKLAQLLNYEYKNSP